MSHSRPFRPVQRTLHTHRLLAPLLLLITLAATAPLPAQTITLKAGGGLEGLSKPSCWVPVVVEVENGGDEVEGRLEADVGWRNDVVHYRRPVRLAPNARQRHTLLVRSDRLPRDLTVRFRGVEADVKWRNIEADDSVVLAVSGDRSALNIVQGLALKAGKSAPAPPGGYYRRSGAPRLPQAYVAHAAVSELFDAALAYDAVDAIALGSVSLRPLTPEQKKALHEWLRAGGTLVVAGGSDVARLQDPFLREVLPVENPVPQPVASLSALGSRFASAMPSGGAVVARAQPRAGAGVWVEQDGIPLIVSHAVGNGTVVFLAFDYDQAPVRGWYGQRGLWREILTQTERPDIVRDLANQGAQWQQYYSGYGGAPPGNLAAAVADVPSMDLPSARLVGLFFLAYILCLVPINYLVLKRYDRREYAWATTPAIVLVFCLVAWFVGHGIRGGSMLLYRLDVAEATAQSDAAAGVSYLGLFSPRRTTYALQAPGAAGLQEASSQPTMYGGPPSSTNTPYTVVEGDDTRVEDLTMNMYAMRVFNAPVQRDLGGRVTASLRYDAVGGIEGTIHNGTRQRLEGGVVVLGQSTCKVGAVSSGDDVEVQWASAKTAPAPYPGGAYPGMPSPPPNTAKMAPAERIRTSALATVQSAVLQANPAAPVLIAWAKGADTRIRVERGRPQETAVSLFVFHLGRPSASGSGTLTLPAGMVPGKFVEYGADTAVYNGEVHLNGNRTGAPSASKSFVVKEFRVPDPRMHIVRFEVRDDGRWQHGMNTGPADKVELSCLNPKTGQWTAVTRTGNVTVVPSPDRFVNRRNGAIRVRLLCPGGIPYTFHKLEAALLGSRVSQ